MEDEIKQGIKDGNIENELENTAVKFDVEQKIPIVEQNLTEEDEENKKKAKNEEDSKEPYRQHGNYSTPSIDSQVLYELYKNHSPPSYRNVDVILYSYHVPWFATAMTDGSKIWFGPRMEFYDPHPNDRLYHELSHWRISTPYGTELDVETMAQLQLPRYNTTSVSYKI